MKMKLIAVAVAGALAAPVAFAQSSVTVSGRLNFAFENIKAAGATLGWTEIPASSSS